MENILKRINELNDFLTTEQLQKMTAEERTRYLELVEKIQARVDALADILEEGGDE